MKAWFSQPDNSFSSYYQNDPGTGKFVRIRLELGRDIPEDATDATVAVTSAWPEPLCPCCSSSSRTSAPKACFEASTKRGFSKKGLASGTSA